MKTTTESARHWAESSRKWRWPAAFTVVLGAVAVAVAALYVDAAAVCGERVAQGKTVPVCSPPSVAQISLLFVPGLLLLLPDLSEINVLGFGFKRDLDETKDKVDETQGTATEQVKELGRAIARLDERSADLGTVRELAGSLHALRAGVRDLELVTARDTEVLRATLKALADVDERLAQVEGRPEA